MNTGSNRDDRIEGATFVRHRGPVTGVALIPGTSKVITAGYDGAVALFDIESGSVDLLGYHRHLVNAVVVNADGTLAATCSSDYSICIWGLDPPRRIQTLLGHSDDVEDFTFVDSRIGVSASRDRRALVWDLGSGAVVRVLDGHDRDVLSVSCQDGRVYTAGDDMTLRVWDLESGSLQRTWGPFEAETDTCAVDSQRRRVVLGCDDGHVRVFDTVTGEMTADVAGHSSGVKKVAISAHLGEILSAAYDRRVVVWDPVNMRKRLEITSPTSLWERSLAWSPDGLRILAGTFDGTVVVFKAETGELEMEIGAGAGADAGNACFNDVASGPDGLLALVSDDGRVRVGRVSGGKAHWQQTLQPASGRVLMNAIAMDSSGKRVATGAHDGVLRLFSVQPNATLIPTFETALGSGPINTVRFVDRIADHAGEAMVGCYSSDIVVVDASGAIVNRFRLHEGAVKALRLHPEQPLGVSCGADGLLLSWDFDGRLLGRYPAHTAIINDVDLDPAGRQLASVSRDFTLKVFDLVTGRLTHSIALGTRSLKSVCFWDSDLIFVGDYWGRVFQARLSSGSVALTFVARNGISAIARCSSQLVCASYDGCVYLLDPAAPSVLCELRAMHQRIDTDGVASSKLPASVA
jgi:WD40 repeat protein